MKYLDYKYDNIVIYKKNGYINLLASILFLIFGLLFFLKYAKITEPFIRIESILILLIYFIPFFISLSIAFRVFINDHLDDIQKNTLINYKKGVIKNIKFFSIFLILAFLFFIYSFIMIIINPNNFNSIYLNIIIKSILVLFTIFIYYISKLIINIIFKIKNIKLI